MKFLTISDVHIKEEGDLPERLFLDFLENALKLEVNSVYLLGDIFDLLVGGHLLYEKMYPRIFKKIKELLERGIRIVQLEGNHDFHFEGLVKKLLNEWSISSNQWIYITEPLIEIIDGRRVLFAHGDEIELGNEPYKRYRRIIRSGFINFLANSVVSPHITRAIGQRASRKSRKKNIDRYNEKYEEELVRPLFRDTAIQAGSDYIADVVICGHSHCFDVFEHNELSYYNNGYLPRSKRCFFFNGQTIEVLELNPSE